MQNPGPWSPMAASAERSEQQCTRPCSGPRDSPSAATLSVRGAVMAAPKRRSAIARFSSASAACVRGGAGCVSGPHAEGERCASDSYSGGGGERARVEVQLAVVDGDGLPDAEVLV